MYTLGIDIGSTASKTVILKDGKEIVAQSVISVGTGTSGPSRALSDVLEKANLSIEDIARTVATGYGRMRYEQADKQVSEITCHAKGVFFHIPTARLIIDIGGQDAKALKLDDDGNLSNFVMNDKCAAGTGRFLDVMSNVLEIGLDDLGRVGEGCENEIIISSTCTVFAESEVISHLSNGHPLPDIVNAIHSSIARRVAGLAMRLGVAPDVVMTGGVAQNIGVVKNMAKELKAEVKVAKDAQLTGALGAALIAWQDLKKMQ